MIEQTEEAVERKSYPNYHFKRAEGNTVYITIGKDTWGRFDLKTMKNEVKDPYTDEETRFIFREAIEFLVAERK